MNPVDFKKSSTAALVLGLAACTWCAGPVQAQSKKAAAKEVVAAPKADPVLLDAMDAELHRALKDLGTAPETGAKAVPASQTQPQPKPYFLSYAVADSENLSINAEYGAVTSDNSTRSRVADVQVRLGSPAQDNTHGDHRTSALTTMALPLTDDKDAIARTLWFATNRGYGKALDALLKVKTEQQVRAKEEDASGDFSTEKSATAMLPAAPKSCASPRPSGKERHSRDQRRFQAATPDIYYDTVSMQASNETDYFVSSEGARVEAPNHVAQTRRS